MNVRLKSMEHCASFPVSFPALPEEERAEDPWNGGVICPETLVPGRRGVTTVDILNSGE